MFGQSAGRVQVPSKFDQPGPLRAGCVWSKSRVNRRQPFAFQSGQRPERGDLIQFWKQTEDLIGGGKTDPGSQNHQLGDRVTALSRESMGPSVRLRVGGGIEMGGDFIHLFGEQGQGVVDLPECGRPVVTGCGQVFLKCVNLRRRSFERLAQQREGIAESFKGALSENLVFRQAEEPRVSPGAKCPNEVNVWVSYQL